jgi:carbon-monoxide dehydrogenase medium subunit
VSAGLAIHRAETLDAAIELLQRYGEDARIVAGSTAVTIMVRQRLIAPAALVAIAGIEGLGGIRRVDGHLEIGALTTHREVELSPLVRETIPVLAETFGVVANVRVRNVATVGGVLAEADYASDPPAVLLALDAEIVARGPSGERTIPIASFFRAFYETALAPEEVLTAVRVPIPPTGTGASYQKFVTRSSEDRPCVGVIAAVRPAADGSIDDLRVAVAAAAETPQRFSDVEATARGMALDEALARRIADEYAGRIEALDDLRGSAWYRTQMIRVWVRRAILAASARAGVDSAATGPSAG